jgi:hypothetical protein
MSNALLTNHNIWVHLDAFARANELVASGCTERIPAEYQQCLALIEELFKYEDAIAASYELEKHIPMLDRIAPMTL